MMRIIAGKYKGRRLSVSRGSIRPTLDRLRESLFNVLGELVEDSVWVDAFAGSGAVGIEALSRGAQYVAFNDRDRAARQTLRKNLEACEVLGGYEILGRDVFALLRDPPADLSQQSVSFLFFDPPYRFGRYRKLLERALVCPLFQPRKTMMILEIFKKTRTDFVPDELSIVRSLTGGDSRLLLIASSDDSRAGNSKD